MSIKNLDNLSLAEGLQLGLEQAIAFKKGDKTKAKSKTIQVREVEKFNSTDIKNIRLQLDLTQKTFAQILGVSVKTVEAWEAGKNHPSGTASRLLEIYRDKPELIEEEKVIAYL